MGISFKNAGAESNRSRAGLRCFMVVSTASFLATCTPVVTSFRFLISSWLFFFLRIFGLPDIPGFNCEIEIREVGCCCCSPSWCRRSSLDLTLARFSLDFTLRMSSRDRALRISGDRFLDVLGSAFFDFPASFFVLVFSLPLSCACLSAFDLPFGVPSWCCTWGDIGRERGLDGVLTSPGSSSWMSVSFPPFCPETRLESGVGVGVGIGVGIGEVILEWDS